MDPIPLNAVWAAAANIAADTAGTAVVVPVADIAADARVALAGAAAKTAVVAADARASLADAAADVVAATDSSADLYRRAATSASIVASTCLALPALPAAFGFEPAGRAWPPSVPSELLLSSSTRTRPPSSSPRLKSVLEAKFRFSGAYAGMRWFKTRRLISCSVA